VHFPRIFFQDFPGHGILKKKNPGLSRRRGNPVDNKLEGGGYILQRLIK